MLQIGQYPFHVEQLNDHLPPCPTLCTKGIQFFSMEKDSFGFFSSTCPLLSPTTIKGIGRSNSQGSPFMAL